MRHFVMHYVTPALKKRVELKKVPKILHMEDTFMMHRRQTVQYTTRPIVDKKLLVYSYYTVCLCNFRASQSKSLKFLLFSLH